MPLRVSVVIPAYNQQKFLLSCLEALAAQDFPSADYEIIIVDDGSTDNTSQFVKNLQRTDKNIKYFFQNNKGPGAARNTGIKMAGSPIIAFTDSDCIPDRNWIKSAIPYFDDILVSGLEGKTVIANPVENTPFSHYAENIRGGAFLTCNIFYRKVIIEAAGGFDERFKLAIREDSDLAFTVLESGGKIIFAPEAIVYHPASNPNYKRHFKKAGEGFYEALLYKKHPRLYRINLKWYDGWAFPVYYYGYFFSLPLFLLAILLAVPFLSKTALLFFLISHFSTIFLACRKKKTTFKDVLILFFHFIIVPYLRLYWVMRGNIFFKTFVW